MTITCSIGASRLRTARATSSATALAAVTEQKPDSVAQSGPVVATVPIASGQPAALNRASAASMAAASVPLNRLRANSTAVVGLAGPLNETLAPASAVVVHSSANSVAA